MVSSAISYYLIKGGEMYYESTKLGGFNSDVNISNNSLKIDATANLLLTSNYSISLKDFGKCKVKIKDIDYDPTYPIKLGFGDSLDNMHSFVLLGQSDTYEFDIIDESGYFIIYCESPNSTYLDILSIELSYKQPLINTDFNNGILEFTIPNSEFFTVNALDFYLNDVYQLTYQDVTDASYSLDKSKLGQGDNILIVKLTYSQDNLVDTQVLDFKVNNQVDYLPLDSTFIALVDRVNIINNSRLADRANIKLSLAHLGVTVMPEDNMQTVLRLLDATTSSIYEQRLSIDEQRLRGIQLMNDLLRLI